LFQRLCVAAPDRDKAETSPTLVGGGALEAEIAAAPGYRLLAQPITFAFWRSLKSTLSGEWLT